MYHTGLPLAECQREATANLLFLLSYTRKLDITEPEISRLTQRRAPFSEILYWIFARRLWDAVRRELLRGYVTVEERLGVLKGRWLVATTARRSDGWRRDHFDVTYDEFTEDNLPNRLLNATVLRLSRWATWVETRSNLAQLRSALAEVEDITPQPQDFSEAARWMQRHRRRAGEGRLYRPLLEMARMFWAGEGPQPSRGRLDAFSFMFDMNSLFEEFVAEFIRRELRDVWEKRGWEFRTQSATRCLCTEAGQNHFWLIPDIRFEATKGQTQLIIDTKYKLLDGESATSGVAETDAYQMFAYKERYQCPRVVLLYPQATKTIARDFGTDTEPRPWLEVRTVDLWRDFSKQSNRKLLAEELRTIIVNQRTTQ
jgi:5-methylcytosine-specific restriction enzyme subunit McrC